MNLTERAIVKNIIDYLKEEKLTLTKAKFKLATTKDMLSILIGSEDQVSIEAITKVSETITTKDYANK